MANPFFVEPANPLAALMAGQQSFDVAQKRTKEADKLAGLAKAGQALQSGGDLRNVLAELYSAGAPEAAGPIAQFANQQADRAFRERQAVREQGNADRSFGLQREQFQEATRQHGVAESKPVAVGAGHQLVVPNTGEVKFNNSEGLSNASTEIAARQIIGGDLSGLTNVGRGAQGDAKLTAIKNKTAEILVSEMGMSPSEAAAHVSKQFQTFRAAGVGASAEARTGATREANLNIILKATEAAIPAALEASAKVARTGWVPVNQIIQKGQVIASNPDLKEFGMANLQLAEHWARAMNPTGVMRESDRDMALHFLSTADSPNTYARAVNQLKIQITRERDAIKSGTSHSTPSTGPTPTPTPAPSPSGGSGKVPPPPPGFVVQ